MWCVFHSSVLPHGVYFTPVSSHMVCHTVYLVCSYIELHGMFELIPLQLPLNSIKNINDYYKNLVFFITQAKTEITRASKANCPAR